MNSFKEFTISDDEADQRLDRWLRRTCGYVTQSLVERMCRKGQIRLDGSRTKPSNRLSTGQIVRIPSSLEGSGARHRPSSGRRKVTAPMLESFRRSIIHCDDQFVAINKPAGLASQGGTGIHNSADVLARAFSERQGESWLLTHRLDRQTTGVLLFARSVPAARKIGRQFRLRQIEKTYWAVTQGVPQPPVGKIDSPVVHPGPATGPKGLSEKNRQTSEGEGLKRALTHYEVLDKAGSKSALLAVYPHTGRTHQIRVHLANLGNAIVGDRKYRNASRKSSKAPSVRFPCTNKLHLHSRSLSFAHPTLERRVRISAAPPDHFVQTCKFFGWELENGDEQAAEFRFVS
ncbi:MAG: RluA family pseudouridine synthase [Rhodobacteraceae bacterium]|nr:RluA family pseudouridine synthase [Paracoccaceae bacterium]